MADTAAHLRDFVLPRVPLRQWVFTLPKRLRFVIAWRPKLISLALRLFLRAVFAWQRRCARRQGMTKPLCEAVTFIQRFGSVAGVERADHAESLPASFAAIFVPVSRASSAAPSSKA